MWVHSFTGYITDEYIRHMTNPLFLPLHMEFLTFFHEGAATCAAKPKAPN